MGCAGPSIAARFPRATRRVPSSGSGSRVRAERLARLKAPSEPESASSCGNGRVDEGERCDDGDRVGGDGCSPD
ncbi:MAG: hypothetical protein GX607_20395 [Myxococcales bacterium]|nr:hypothetical protein [Myxococcales bacterium]